MCADYGLVFITAYTDTAARILRIILTSNGHLLGINRILKLNGFLRIMKQILKNLVNLFFLDWYSGGWSPLWPVVGLLCLPRVIMMIEKLVE
jgi:hypothetical protein